MRHKNIYNGTHGWHSRHNAYLPEPYGEHLEYKRPSMTRTYCKLLQVVADHPGAKRKELIARTFIDKEWLASHDGKIRPDHDRSKMWDAGDFSWVTYNPSKYFAELLWADLIDYDEKTYRYRITSKGQELLEEAYLNDNVKTVTGKYPWQKKNW